MIGILLKFFKNPFFQIEMEKNLKYSKFNLIMKLTINKEKIHIL